MLDPICVGLHTTAIAEVFWAALHGLVVLDRGGRQPHANRAERLALLIPRFGGMPA
ncbi:hypothetical protein [Amycolatopsis sulphurea]|uniref:hypothetical protein n=1 Tax=Amycolatopsis sulphurea TaxID=76022 RepID=UPI00147606AE|nr:hypothetical protein [Amycolatopsis sulphurea]